MDFLKSLRGKVSKFSDFYFAERYGTQYTGKLTHRRTTPYSPHERLIHDRFRTTSAAVAAALADPIQKAHYLTLFHAQTRYRTLRGFLFAYLYPKD